MAKLKDLEPTIYRQRIILEGHYTINIDGEVMKSYMQQLSENLGMRIFSGPFCYPPDRWNDPEGIPLQDWNGFVMWLESGCHCYAFPRVNFFTVDAYSCKPFDAQLTAEFTRDYFKSEDMQFREV